MTGGWIESYPEDVKSIFAHGHDLGNHSEKHKHMSTISMRECEEELVGPHKKVQELTGYDMFLFRPPYGDYNNTLIEAADECGYYTIQWSVDSLDWKDYGADNIVKTVLNHKNLKDGAIIPMMEPRLHAPKPGEKINLEIRHYGNADGTYRLYDDDGETFDYEKGMYSWREISVSHDRNGKPKGHISKAGKGKPNSIGKITWRFMTDKF